MSFVLSLIVLCSVTSYLGICYSLCLECCSLILWSADSPVEMPDPSSSSVQTLALLALTELTTYTISWGQRSGGKKRLF